MRITTRTCPVAFCLSSAIRVNFGSMSTPEASTTRPALDPVMVAGFVGGTVGDSAPGTWAIWQVETDPDVTLGDFSGAWIIDSADAGADRVGGIRGFAAQAEWIDERQDPVAMLRTVLRYPVIPVDEATAAALTEVLGQSSGIEIVAFSEVERASGEEIEAAKREFAAESPGKKQPAWGSIGALEIAEKLHPIAGLDGDAAAAAGEVLRYARGLRAWIRAWNAFDKLRIRRLSAHEQPSGLPL